MTDNTKYEVTRDEALSFCETAMRNWQYVAFSEDELDDLRVGLERFLSARLTSQPAPGDGNQLREALWWATAVIGHGMKMSDSFLIAGKTVTVEEVYKAGVELCDSTTPEQLIGDPTAISNALAFFQSVIKSGESWTATCQRAYDDALRALKAISVQPAQSDLAEGLREVREAIACLSNVTAAQDHENSMGQAELALERAVAALSGLTSQPAQSDLALYEQAERETDHADDCELRLDLGSRTNLCDCDYRFRVAQRFHALATPTAPQPNRESVEQAVNNCLVRITEAAVMCLDADDDDTTRLEAFGRGIEGYLRNLAFTHPTTDTQSDAVRELGGQDRKFGFDGQQFVNRVSGEPIPLDEPIIIFRARDRHAEHVLRDYLSMVEDEHHKQAVRERMLEFSDWRAANPDKMKEPGITRDIHLNKDIASPTDREGDRLEWRPIENYEGHGAVLVSRPTTAREAFSATTAFFDATNVWRVFRSKGGMTPLPFKPTHWMPLPEAPAHLSQFIVGEGE